MSGIILRIVFALTCLVFLAISGCGRFSYFKNNGKPQFLLFPQGQFNISEITCSIKVLKKSFVKPSEPGRFRFSVSSWINFDYPHFPRKQCIFPVCSNLLTVPTILL